MSSRAKKIRQNVKEKQSRMYMNNMYDLFNLSLFQLLKLRHMYRSYMRKSERERKLLAIEIRRSYRHGSKKVRFN